MSGLRRVAVVLLIAAAVIVWGASFEVAEVQRRAIVLGLGIDLDENDGSTYVLTAEVVSPGNGGEQVGIFSKTVTSGGKSVGEAIAELGEKTGKQPSLGQCGVLVLGRSLFAGKDFSDVLEYFVKSDSFKENAIVCCTDNAAELMNKSEALSQSVSLALAEALNENSKKVAIPSNTLLKYARSQAELTKTGFLNLVRFVPSDNVDPDAPDKETGYFFYDRMAIFRANKLVCELSDDEINGFAALTESVVGDTVTVVDDGKTYAVRVNAKSVDYKLTDGVCEVTISLQVKLGRADSSDVGGVFAAQTDKQISDEMLEAMRKQIAESVALFVRRQSEDDFDLVELHDLLRRRDGSSEELNAMPTADIPVQVTVKVAEK